LQNENKPFQIIAIALDNFKIVNEVFGMEGGDQLLRMMVKHLHKLYSQNQVYRYNGDIFAVVLDEMAESSKEVDRIRKLLRHPWQINGVEVELSACICRIPKELYKESNSELIKAIDYGVNAAKQRGKGQYFVMDDSATKEMERRAAIEHAMRDAIDAGKFEVHYQPIFDTKQGRFHSLEALARLQVEGYGYVSPEEFIRIAEQNGMIMDIGMLVLREVCRLIRDERIDELGVQFVEVNLSVVQCMQENYHEGIMELLEHYNVSPKMINLEITETAAAYSEDRLVRNMARMSLMDITFSMDDYGSGYSNVNYLVDMPFSIIKLDKYFVWAAFKKVKMRKILENTISMFHDINLKVVAEGVEDEEMVNALTQLGVEYLQGYYYSKPLPRTALMDLLQGVNA
jgi:diguanylate cyclase (GGDEF)-like protein